MNEAGKSTEMYDQPEQTGLNDQANAVTGNKDRISVPVVAYILRTFLCIAIMLYGIRSLNTELVLFTVPSLILDAMVDLEVVRPLLRKVEACIQGKRRQLKEFFTSIYVEISISIKIGRKASFNQPAQPQKP